MRCGVIASSVAPIFISPGRPTNSNSNSTICRPIEDGAFRCDSVGGADDGKAFGVVLVVISVVIVLLALSAMRKSWLDDRQAREDREKLESDLKKTVSERMPRW